MELDKLEKIEIDIPNKIFKINGVPIAENCTELEISFHNGEWCVDLCERQSFFVDGTPLRDKLRDEV